MNRQVIAEFIGNPAEMTYGNRKYRVENDGASCRLTFIEGPYGKWRWQVDEFKGADPYYDEPYYLIDDVFRSLTTAECESEKWLSLNLRPSMRQRIEDRFSDLLGLPAAVQQALAPSARVTSILMPVTDDQLRDAGLLPSLPPESIAPEPWLVRWRRAVRLRYWALRWRLAEVIAGQSLDQDEDW